MSIHLFMGVLVCNKQKNVSLLQNKPLYDDTRYMNGYIK